MTDAKAINLELKASEFEFNLLSAWCIIVDLFVLFIDKLIYRFQEEKLKYKRNRKVVNTPIIPSKNRNHHRKLRNAITMNREFVIDTTGQ